MTLRKIEDTEYLKEEALRRAAWRTRCENGCAPVARTADTGLLIETTGVRCVACEPQNKERLFFPTA
jgi:hypothetical protein